MSNSTRSRSRSRTNCLLGKERIDGDRELAGDPFQKREFRRTGFERRQAAETESSQPVFPSGQRHQGQRPGHRSRAAACMNSGQRVSSSTEEITSGCWFTHTQPVGSCSMGNAPHAGIDGTGRIKNVRPQALAVLLVKDQNQVLEIDYPPKGFRHP